MDNLQVFKNELFEVGATVEGEQVLFDAEQVARCLGLEKTEMKNGNSYTSIRWNRVNEYLGFRPLVVEGGNAVKHPQQVKKGSLIPEAMVYKLAFKASNDVAEQFQDWLATDVLPTIRKTGGYVADDDLFISTYLPHADETTKMMFRATLKTVRTQNEQLSVMQPKAEYFDALVERNLLTNIRETAKELHIKETDFIQWLLSNKYMYRDQKYKLKPYAQYTPELFELKEWTRNGKTGVQTLITPKGRETFRLLYRSK